MKKVIILHVLILIVYSCQEHKKEYKSKQNNIRNVYFQLPTDFVLKQNKSEDTQVYDILHDKKLVGTIFFGHYYKPFFEDHSITEEKEVYKKVSSKGGKIFYTSNLELDYKNGAFNDNYYYYDTINKNVAQVMLPKKLSKGLIGIYLDSVDNHNNKFIITSSDLSDENKKIFLDIFRTIKVTPSKE